MTECEGGERSIRDHGGGGSWTESMLCNDRCGDDSNANNDHDDGVPANDNDEDEQRPRTRICCGASMRDAPRRKRYRANSFATTLLLSSLLLLLLSAFHIPTSILPQVVISAAEQIIPSSDYNAPVSTYDGPASLAEGRRLFQLGQYDRASSYLWQAVILHTNGDNSKLYKVDDAFTPFLQCYLLQNKIVDGLIFVAAESYLRGQEKMGELYLGQALERDAGHGGALELQNFIREDEDDGGDEIAGAVESRGKAALQMKKARRLKRLKEIRDGVDAANSKNQQVQKEGKDDDGFWNQFSQSSDKATNNKAATATSSQTQSSSSSLENLLKDKTPEEIYNIGTVHFNSKNLAYAARIFERSCQKSHRKLFPACTNAVYLRTNLCDWGFNGTGFERDMRIIAEVTVAEARMFRRVESGEGVSEEERRFSGLGYNVNFKHNDEEQNELILWQRGASVHPHMMLGYPLGNENAMLKRYAAEATASLDELRARADNDDGIIAQRPSDLPFSVAEMREKFVEKHRKQQLQQTDGATPPIKVGFVACSFNSKAVLYLSHDMFRFFDPSLVEIHIFSTGPPDNPRFINEVMRGVDWRQRVVDNADYFHDVREYKNDHVGLARYIRGKEMQILIEWDGYARQGERAQGLMALRPAPIQILHQEFLMTSGAQYFDYIVTDEVTSPLRLEGLYTEKFLYMPNHFFSKGHGVQKEVLPPALEYVPREKGAPFQIGVGSPQENACLSPNPLGSNNFDDGEESEVSFVYCNFNKFLKHNPETVRSWIRILEEVPNSILCLLNNPVEGVPNLRKFVTEASTSADDNEDGETDTNNNLNARIHFLPWENNPFDHQRRSHSLCNVMLDSHPYNGHTTAQDSLFAGVPIVTRSDGDDMSSRVSTSANVVLGLEELNAPGGTTEYEDIAIKLGNDKSWFGDVRERLVETCLRKDPMHPYWDVPRYVNNLQNGLKLIWNNFIDGKELDHVEVIEDEDITGTTEAELVAKEEKREYWKRRRRHALGGMDNGDEL